MCHATQPGKDTAATGTSVESKRPSQRCVKSREPDPGKKGKELEQAPLEQGYSTDLTTPSHQQGAYEAPPSANMPKKVLFPMPLDTVALPGRV